MRDSLGGSMLLNLVIIFASLVIIFFAGILSYSKAFCDFWIIDIYLIINNQNICASNQKNKEAVL